MEKEAPIENPQDFSTSFLLRGLHEEVSSSLPSHLRENKSVSCKNGFKITSANLRQKKN
jgi:hypothetical protein